MSLLLPVALWAAFAAAEPDSKTEADLRHQLTLSQEQNAALKKELSLTEAKLQQQLAVARDVPKDLSKKVQVLVEAHRDEKDALEQTQAATSQTLVNTDMSITKQIEFERQLVSVQKDVVVSNGNISTLLKVNICSMILVFCFLGFMLYPNLWRNRQQGAVKNGGI